MLLLAWLSLLTAASQRDRPVTEHPPPSSLARMLSAGRRMQRARLRSIPAHTAAGRNAPAAAPTRGPRASPLRAAAALVGLRAAAALAGLRAAAPTSPARAAAPGRSRTRRSRRSAPLAARARERRSWIGGVDG